MRGAIPPLPNTPSWRGAQLQRKHRDNLLPRLLPCVPRDCLAMDFPLNSVNISVSF
jgi:hypothetical protein